MGPSIYDFNFIFHKHGGNRIDFEPSDEDTADATYKYYGYLSSQGAWLIMRFDLTTPNIVLYRYAAGKTGYAANWAGRAGLSYSLFSDINPL